MSRAVKPPTLWDRSRRSVIVALLVFGVVLGIFVSVGVGALLIGAAIGIGAFAGGSPPTQGLEKPSSVPGTFRGSGF